jgi:hypothetical protein
MAIVKVSKTIKMWMGQAKVQKTPMNRFWVDVLRESAQAGRQATFTNSNVKTRGAVAD